MNTLNSTAKGKISTARTSTPKSTYTRPCLAGHQAAGITQTAELKNLIQKAAPVIQGHLDKAGGFRRL
jgi:hypothetical protein